MMPQVPKYDTAQVEERATPGVRLDSAASPELLGSTANSQIAQGNAEIAAGTGLAAVAYHMQEKDNLRKVQDAATAYGQQVQDFQIKAQRDRTGAASQGLVTDFTDFHTKTMNEIADKLDNPAQKQAFVAMARKSGLAARHDVATFEIAQTRQANIATFDATVKNNIDMGATAITPEATGTYKSNVINNTKAFAAAQNLTPEVEQALLTKNLTEFHAQKIQQLAQTDPASATAYFEANKPEIAGSRQAEIGAFAQKATAEKMGVDAAGEIWAKLGPDKGLDAMEEAARERFKNDPFTLKATISNLRERTTAFDKGQAERVDNVAAAVNTAVLKGASPSQIRAMPEFIALSGMGGAGVKMANSIVDHLENKAYTATLRATAEDNRAYTRGLREQQVLSRLNNAAYWRYSDPDVVAGMTRNQIINLAPQIGDDHTQRLLQQHDSYAKSAEALQAAKINKNVFDALAIGAGLDPNKKGKSEDDKDRLTQLNVAVDERLVAAAHAKGRPLTFDEKKKEAQQAFDDKVRTPGFFSIFGHGTSDERPVSALTADELKTAFVEVPVGRGVTENVRLSTIPPTFTVDAESQLRAAGRPANQRSIAQMWVINRDAWRKQQGGR